MTQRGALIAGLPRSATTWLFHALASHPEVAASRIKEPHFFATDLPMFRRVRSQREYQGLFDRPALVRLDGSVYSGFSSVAIAAFAAAFDDARVIMTVRNPTEFLPAIHHELKMAVVETERDLATAWFRDLAAGDDHPLRYPAMCRYGEILARAESALGTPDRILVLTLDAIAADPNDVVALVEKFLGLSPAPRSVPGRINPATTYRSRLLGRLITRPPWPFSALKRTVVRRIAREDDPEAPGIGPLLRRLNRRLNRRELDHPRELPPAVRSSLMEHIADDLPALTDRIGDDAPWL